MAITGDLPSSAALVGGAALGWGLDLAIDKYWPAGRLVAAGVGLVTAAAIYPAARRGRRGGADGRREALTLAAAAGLSATVTRLPSDRARRLLGLGWMAHAGYDAVVTHDTSSSRLPSWYPAGCAGYDLALGTRLLLK